jgi:hypothetical protein
VRGACAAAALLVLALAGCDSSGTAPIQQRAAPPASTASAPAAAERRTVPSPTSHDLSADEAMGGHTLERHVGRSDADLIERLRREPQISSASTYTDRAAAETVVGAALAAETPSLAAWRERRGRRPNFVLRYRADRVIGRSMGRGRTTAVACDRALVVLRWDERRARAYVLTSYPEASR